MENTKTYFNHEGEFVEFMTVDGHPTSLKKSLINGIESRIVSIDIITKVPYKGTTFSITYRHGKIEYIYDIVNEKLYNSDKALYSEFLRNLTHIDLKMVIDIRSTIYIDNSSWTMSHDYDTEIHYDAKQEFLSDMETMKNSIVKTHHQIVMNSLNGKEKDLKLKVA